MSNDAWVTGLVGFVGVGLGGGLQLWGQRQSREHEDKRAVLTVRREAAIAAVTTFDAVAKGFNEWVAGIVKGGGVESVDMTGSVGLLLSALNGPRLVASRPTSEALGALEEETFSLVGEVANQPPTTKDEAVAYMDRMSDLRDRLRSLLREELAPEKA